MEIQEIKDRLPMSRILHYYGLKPDKQLRLQCPFHKDKTPSMQVYYKTHTAFCFSTNCQTHGKSLDVIDFIMYREQLSKHEAIKRAVSLIETEGVKKEKATALKTNMITKERFSVANQDDERILFLERMFTSFRNAVHCSKPAQVYLQSRMLDFKKTEVGYNGGQFHHGKRREEHLINDCIKYGLLLDLGLLGRTGERAYKPFGKWGLVFALRNPSNRIVSFYFRSILEDKAQRHFYLKDRQGLYPGYPSPSTKKLIFTESIIDCATLLEQKTIATNYSVLALYGTNGLTKEHNEALKQLNELEEIIFFLNGDEPGIKAVEKYAPVFKTDYPKIKITSVEVPQNEDVNSLLKGHSDEILLHLIETRKEYTVLVLPIEPTAIQDNTEGKALSFSNEIPSDEKENQSTENLQSSNLQSINNVLETTNPYNLKFQRDEVLYQIKGFRLDQLDSLKITLQVTI
jgi:DNA primase